MQLDLGAFTTALEYACDVKAEIVGKPAESFYKAALDDMGVQPDEVW